MKYGLLPVQFPGDSVYVVDTDQGIVFQILQKCGFQLMRMIQWDIGNTQVSLVRHDAAGLNEMTDTATRRPPKEKTCLPGASRDGMQ